MAKIKYLMVLFIIIIGVFLFTRKITEGHIGFKSKYLDKYYKEEGIIHDRNKMKLIKNGIIFDYDKGINDKNVSKICNSKILTSSMLLNNNLPAPKYIIWDKSKDDDTNMILINNKLKYPLVVKPSNGMNGTDVYMNNNNKMDIIDSVRKVKGVSNIMVEEQITGKSYRILIFRGVIIGILERIPAQVVGNGKKKLRALIKEYNRKNISIGKQPIKLIAINYINEQGYNIDSVIPYGKKVILSLNINSANGSGLKNVNIEDVHKDNIDMFKKCYDLSGITLVGIDYISKDISVPYNINGGVINELNSGPSINTHHKIDPNQIKKLVGLIF